MVFGGRWGRVDLLDKLLEPELDSEIIDLDERV
jgi:hypothetical protein